MRHLLSPTSPRVLLVGILLLSTLANSACRSSLGVATDPDGRSATELREAARRDLKISAFFQAVSLGLYAWAIGNDSVSDGDQEILVTTGAVAGLLSFGSLYNGVMNTMEAQEQAALRSDENLEEFAREATSTPEGR